MALASQRLAGETDREGSHQGPEIDQTLQTMVRKLREMIDSKGALKHGNFKLASGGFSPYYFDGRLLTLDPAGADLIGRAFLPVVREAGAEAVGGPALGADPIAKAIA